MTPEQYQLLVAKIDLVSAKLEAMALQRPFEPSTHTPTIPTKVAAALSRYGENLPRNVRVTMRTRAMCLLGEGMSEDQVVSAIATGEGREAINAMLVGT